MLKLRHIRLKDTRSAEPTAVARRLDSSNASCPAVVPSQAMPCAR
jgi:hypothetical protein